MTYRPISVLYSFIHSGCFYSAPSSPLLLRGAPNYIGGSRRSAQATVSKGLAQGPYVAVRAGVEPTILRLKVIGSTNASPPPTRMCVGLYVGILGLRILGSMSNS